MVRAHADLLAHCRSLWPMVGRSARPHASVDSSSTMLTLPTLAMATLGNNTAMGQGGQSP
eukprot:9844248-Alexandrium_andersonii.AAC.1